MTSTLWTVQLPGQVSSNVEYNEANLTYNDVQTQYGGTYVTVWTVQPTGQ